MKECYGQMRFAHSWRPYQERALRDLEYFREDNRIHVVAAPGAGKTVLGLEIIRRLGRKALVLAPTNLICDQWEDRLQRDFLDGQRSDWVAREPDADASKLLICTYQYFFLHYREFKGCFDVLVLDEAHHLRNAWWEAIFASLEEENHTVVSLTATPPIDADDKEWGRYYDLCGEVDIEISSPELVQQGNLCPYQDLLYVIQDKNTKPEQNNHREDVLGALKKHSEFVSYLREHEWIKDPRRHATSILENPEHFVAMISYLRENGIDASLKASELFGMKSVKWPKLDNDWLEVLLNAELDHLPSDMIDALFDIKALKNEHVSFQIKEKTSRTDIKLQLKAISDIIQFERNAENDLCCAVLTDHVGKTGFKSSKPINDLSTSSLFHRLWKQGKAMDLAVVTGSVAVLPCEISTHLGGVELKQYPGYKMIEGATAESLACAEQAMMDRTIRVMIGTRSLLGQGWDLPVLNTLLLATKTNAFISTNQLRGRVMRIDPNNPNKTANIWHFASAADDIGKLEKRFHAFSRLVRATNEIRSGYPMHPDIEAINEQSFHEAATRNHLAKEWKTALHEGDGRERFLREVSAVEFDSVSFDLPMSRWDRFASIFGSRMAKSSKARAFKRMIKASIHSLEHINRIFTPIGNIRYSVQVEEHAVSFQVFGMTKPEETRIHNAIAELFEPIENPRYLLEVKPKFLGSSKAYYSIPKEFARHKELADIFTQNWQKYVGKCKAQYTRTKQGRTLLIAARLNCPVTNIKQNMFWS